jgi:hypothetical protein
MEERHEREIHNDPAPTQPRVHKGACMRSADRGTALSRIAKAHAGRKGRRLHTAQTTRCRDEKHTPRQTEKEKTEKTRRKNGQRGEMVRTCRGLQGEAAGRTPPWTSSDTSYANHHRSATRHKNTAATTTTKRQHEKSCLEVSAFQPLGTLRRPGGLTPSSHWLAPIRSKVYHSAYGATQHGKPVWDNAPPNEAAAVLWYERSR